MQNIKSKIRQNTAVCLKVKKQLNTNALMNLYHSMIETHLRYGIDSWCFGNTIMKNSIQRSCNKFLKTIFKTNNETQLAIKMEQNKILSLDQLLFLEIGLSMFKIHLHTYPSALQNLFSTTTLSRVTRSRNVLRFETPRIQLTKPALSYKGPHIWKNIPNFVKFCNEDGETFRSVNDFKSHLISFLLSIGIVESNRIVDEILNSIV